MAKPPVTLAEVKLWADAIEFAFPGKVEVLPFSQPPHEFGATHLVRVRLWVKLLYMSSEGAAALWTFGFKVPPTSYHAEQVIELDYLANGPETLLDIVRHMLHNAVCRAVDEGLHMYGCTPFYKQL